MGGFDADVGECTVNVQRRMGAARMRRTSDEIRGNGIGAILLSFFGSMWMLIALHGHLLLLVCSLLVPLLLVVRSAGLIRGSKRLSKREPPQTASEIVAENALQKRFTWIFAGEGIAIFLVVNVLANIGMSSLTVPAIGVIVGLHFLPLARVFRRPLYYWSGATQVLLCVGAALALRSAALEAMNMVIGLGMALILWSTMLIVVTGARRSLQLLESALPVGR